MLRSMGEREREAPTPHLPSYITAPTLKHTHPFDIILILSMEREKKNVIILLWGVIFIRFREFYGDFVALTSNYTASHCITTITTVYCYGLQCIACMFSEWFGVF